MRRVFPLLALIACGDAAARVPEGADGGSLADAGPRDAGTSPAPDAGTADAGTADAGPADAGLPGCSTPVPFSPPGSTTAWRHTTTRLVVVTQGAPNHRGQDVVAVRGGPQLLVGKFAYGAADKDLKDEEVEVFVQQNPPCGAWMSYGTALTSEDGEYGTQFGIEDDGGRVFFSVPAERRLPEGVWPVRMLVRGDHSVAAFTLFVLAPGTNVVVFDIDGTLTTGDDELLQELWDDIWGGTHVPAMQAGAPAVVRAWEQKGYLPVYLTGRPDFLRARSQSWLVDRGFPAGAVHLTDTNAQALPTSAGVARYKADFLARLKADAGAVLYAAYGNATTDIEAYAAAGIPKARTFIVGPHAGKEGTVAIDYVSHLTAALAMPLAAVGAPASIGWW